VRTRELMGKVFVSNNRVGSTLAGSSDQKVGSGLDPDSIRSVDPDPFSS
jgi:hypothetical protein